MVDRPELSAVVDKEDDDEEDAEPEELLMVDRPELPVAVDEEDDDAAGIELMGVTTGLEVGDPIRGSVMALWRGSEVLGDVVDDWVVDNWVVDNWVVDDWVPELAISAVSVLVNVELSELEGGTPLVPVDFGSCELAASADPELASIVEVANVELSAVDVVVVSESSDVSVELPGPDSACRGILAACARRHGRLLRGPASTAAASDRACIMSVVVRILAVLGCGDGVLVVVVKVEKARIVKIVAEGLPEKRRQVK
jgi:hypothetical protein